MAELEALVVNVGLSEEAKDYLDDMMSALNGELDNVHSEMTDLRWRIEDLEQENRDLEDRLTALEDSEP